MTVGKDTPVLVTGAGGFIGSHLVEWLVRAGARVTAFVHYNSRGDWGLLSQIPEEVRGKVRIIQGDIRDASTVDGVVAGHEIVFHLAALIGIPYSYVSPDAYVATNVQGTLNVLEASRRAGVRRLVHTSTSEVYGTAKQLPINEDHPLQGQSPYSASKIAADKLVESYILSFDLPAVTLRPFNTYGPRQSARAIIPTVISQALARDRVEVGALDPVRDFTFVADIVEAFVGMMDAQIPLAHAVNAGSGIGISVRELAQRVLAIVGRDVPIVQSSARFRPEHSEVGALIADATRAKELLGWEPRVSLDQGLARTVEFIRKHPELYDVSRYAV
jgi:NAD dependent epimerase/dehydratase